MAIKLSRIVSGEQLHDYQEFTWRQDISMEGGVSKKTRRFDYCKYSIQIPRL
jgi:hypothetical protein